MKGIKVSLVIMVAALLTLGTGGMAFAFHSGGVAECEGCHSMHSPAAPTVTGLGGFLLVGGTQSETCLTCHEKAGDTGPSSYHISTVTADLGAGTNPRQRTPGGDFGWLKKTFTYTYGTTTYNETGGGHNVVAPTNGYNEDADHATAPGGTYSAANLACNSCHDPHGKARRLEGGAIATTGAPIWASGSYNSTTANEPAAGKAVGAYRLLAGSGYTNALSGTIGFTGVPVAKAPSTYNQSEATNPVRVAYGKAIGAGTANWGDWCKTCHAGMHSGTNTVHPTDEDLGSTIAANYKAYVKSGDITNTTAANEYLTLAPFIQNATLYTDLSAKASNAAPTATTGAGPDSLDEVSCLSCHRAHASGFAHMLRYDYGYEFMTKGGQYIGSDNPEVTGSRAPLQHRGRTNADWQAAYYDRDAGTNFATYQRVLCNKCHAKD